MFSKHDRHPQQLFRHSLVSRPTPSQMLHSNSLMQVLARLCLRALQHSKSLMQVLARLCLRALQHSNHSSRAVQCGLYQVGTAHAPVLVLPVVTAAEAQQCAALAYAAVLHTPNVAQQAAQQQQAITACCTAHASSSFVACLQGRHMSTYLGSAMP